MATLTNVDFTQIKNWVRSSPYWEDFKSSGLSKQQFYDLFQALEDWEVGGHLSAPTVSRDAALETAAGQTVTTAFGQAIWLAWATWKASTVL